MAVAVAGRVVLTSLLRAGACGNRWYASDCPRQVDRHAAIVQRLRVVSRCPRRCVVDLAGCDCSGTTAAVDDGAQTSARESRSARDREGVVLWVNFKSVHICSLPQSRKGACVTLQMVGNSLSRHAKSSVASWSKSSQPVSSTSWSCPSRRSLIGLCQRERARGRPSALRGGGAHLELFPLALSRRWTLRVRHWMGANRLE